MTRWEYFTGFIGYSYEEHKIQKILDGWGQAGWEMTGYVRDDGESGRYFYMKRVCDD